MTEPRFFSKEWADAVREALIAGPSEQVKEGKLQEYWDFYELLKSSYPASWPWGAATCPLSSARARRTCWSSGAAAQ